MSEFEKYLCPQCGTMQESLKAELARLTGEVAGDYSSDDGMSPCERCNGMGVL